MLELMKDICLGLGLICILLLIYFNGLKLHEIKGILREMEIKRRGN